MNEKKANKRALGSSFGKCILSGEHSVVYGHPAVVMSLGLETRVEVVEVMDGMQVFNFGQNTFLENILKIFQKFRRNQNDGRVPELHLKVNGNLPFGKGLGGSAAIAHAAFKALAAYEDVVLTKEMLLELVQENEKFAHGNPSGVDATVVVYPGLLRFQKKETGLEFLSLGQDGLKGKTFFLLDSGKPAETTKEMVSLVKRRAEESDEVRTALMSIGELTTSLSRELEAGKFAPEIFTQNQRYLETIGVVSPSTTELIREVEGIGGFAKVTGAGGANNGSGMVLVYHPEPEKFTRTLRSKFDENSLPLYQFVV